MKVGLIDVDSHNFPSLALMKISSWHKAQGDDVEWWWGFGQYDRVYMSKIFDDTYTADKAEPVNAAEIIKGGTGYFRRNKDGNAEAFAGGEWKPIDGDRFQDGDVLYMEALPSEIEQCCPDYDLYPEFSQNAYGHLTRGCPNNCGFCLVPCKKCKSDNVAYEHYNGRGGAAWRVKCFDCGHTVDKGNRVRHDAQVNWNKECKV